MAGIVSKILPYYILASRRHMRHTFFTWEKSAVRRYIRDGNLCFCNYDALLTGIDKDL